MKILTVEDDPVSARLLELSLKQWGHEVVVAADGAAAWERFQKERFDVVVTDWMMPEIDGLELTRLVRQMRGREYTWVILLTTRNFKDHFATAMEAGVDDFLEKPLDRDLLRVRLFVAARVQRSRRQVEELSRLIPICMHCKSIRPDPAKDWHRVEEFLERYGDLTHGYCPDCYWDRSVKPDLQALASFRGAPKDEAALDVMAAAALDAFDKAKIPGIAEDVRNAFRDLATTRMKNDLDALRADRAMPRGGALERYREAADAIGAGRLSGILELLQANPSAELAALAADETERVLAALFPPPVPPARASG